MFCKETSKSIKKSKRRKMYEGFYACNTPPYGYKKSEDEPGKLIIDENSAKVVKKIFELKIKHMTSKQIAEQLNKEKIPTPAQYLKVKGLPQNSVKIWTRTSVSRILGNPVYTGDCIRGKTQNISYKSKKKISVRRKDYIVTKNTHEAIISKDVFEKIHNDTLYGSTKQDVNRINTKFADLMYCAYCHKKMTKRIQKGGINLHCASNRESNELCSFKENYFYEQIEPIIIEEIQKTFESYFKDKTLKKSILKRQNTLKIKELERLLNGQDIALKRISFKISQLYNDRLSGKISEEEYKNNYAVLIEERNIANENKEKLELDLEKFQNIKLETSSEKDIINNLIKKIKRDKFSLEDMNKIISKIEIGKGIIIIHFAFSDIADKKISTL